MSIIEQQKEEYNKAKDWLSAKDAIGMYIHERGLAEFVTVLEEKMNKQHFRQIVENLERTVTDSCIGSESKSKLLACFTIEKKIVPATTILLKAGLAKRNLMQNLEAYLSEYIIKMLICSIHYAKSTNYHFTTVKWVILLGSWSLAGMGIQMEIMMRKVGLIKYLNMIIENLHAHFTRLFFTFPRRKYLFKSGL